MRLARANFVASIATALLICATAVFAQTEELRNTTPQQRAMLDTAFMKKKLKLSPQQVEQVREINLKYAQQMEPIIKGSEGKMRKARQARSISQAKDEELKTVLSPQQYQGYLASKEQMRRRMIQKAKEKRGGGA